MSFAIDFDLNFELLKDRYDLKYHEVQLELVNIFKQEGFVRCRDNMFRCAQKNQHDHYTNMRDILISTDWFVNSLIDIASSEISRRCDITDNILVKANKIIVTKKVFHK